MARVSINQPINCTFGLTVNLITMPQGYSGGSVTFPRGSGVQLYSRGVQAYFICLGLYYLIFQLTINQNMA